MRKLLFAFVLFLATVATVSAFDRCVVLEDSYGEG